MVYIKLKCDVTYKLKCHDGNCLVLLLFMTSYAKQCLVPIVLIQEETNLFLWSVFAWCWYLRDCWCYWK